MARSAGARGARGGRRGRRRPPRWAHASTQGMPVLTSATLFHTSTAGAGAPRSERAKIGDEDVERQDHHDGAGDAIRRRGRLPRSQAGPRGWWRATTEPSVSAAWSAAAPARLGRWRAGRRCPETLPMRLRERREGLVGDDVGLANQAPAATSREHEPRSGSDARSTSQADVEAQRAGATATSAAASRAEQASPQRGSVRLGRSFSRVDASSASADGDGRDAAGHHRRDGERWLASAIPRQRDPAR